MSMTIHGFYQLLGMPNGWIYLYPQYHALILLLVFVALTILAAILAMQVFILMIALRIWRRISDECPHCGMAYATTRQRCSSVRARFLNRQPGYSYGSTIRH